MIPENKHSAVSKALQTAFGVTEWDSIQQMTKGLSEALVFKLVIRSNPYLLRVVVRDDTRDKPIHYFGSMQAAAEAGIAPAIHYLSSDDGVSITDFIVEKPFSFTEAIPKMADIIRQVHELPKFSHRVNYVDVVDTFLQRLQATGILPESLINELLASYERIIKVYPRNDSENFVSCHNDLKPDNIIFDGDRPWLVDWEAAFLNDRYVDLAAMGNFIVRSEQDETDFLRSYFGQEATDYQRARFLFMSQIVHVFCFALCVLLSTGGKSISEKTVEEMEKLDFRDFHDQLWNCEISLESSEAKRQYAWVHLQQFLRNVQSKRFDESLAVLSQSSLAN
ncbi:phosphotransferase [Spirosoma sp. BT702]|uniref:Phosphotransferase n=1 Tax=Spirosoma profusum TaxID=2771354 RepID=A0A926XVX8_9BACT|nr:phosphotransferase [Spirosoma profusum]MBD2701542.1 phosphotransferase [Spirosoma profusum]